MADESKTGATTYEKTILLTGGAGFIGSHVLIRLVKNYPQYRVINFDKLDYCASLKNLESIRGMPNYKFVKGSVTSPDLVNYVMESESIDTVMHFAAQTHVDNSFGNSFLFTENNILGTHVLLEAAKTNKVKLFIHVSTDEVYGHGAEGDDHTEVTKLNPTNPYAATKAGAEFLVKAYHQSFDLPVIITRGNNVFGPHQYPEKIIPKFTNQLMRGLPLTVHGDGSNKRNFLFVEDVAAAFDLVLHKGRVGEVYNIGGGNEVSNLEMARILLGEFGLADQEDKYITFVGDRPFNDFRYPLNSEKLRAEMGWSESVTFEEGLKRTVAWYREFSGNWDNVESALVAHPRRGLTARELHGEPSRSTSSADLAKLAKASAAAAGAGTIEEDAE